MKRSRRQADDVGKLIDDFSREWLIPLERLAQTVFVNENFQQAIATNTTKAFLQDSNRLVLRKSFQQGIRRVVVPADSSYAILHALFKPLFDLIKKGTTFLWGGINYWDTVASDFYSEQFTNLNAIDVEIFKRGMEWGIGPGTEPKLLPLTTFIFEKCKPIPNAAVFGKNVIPVQPETGSRTIFYDLVGQVSLPPSTMKEELRASLAENGNSIFDTYFNTRRPVKNVSYYPAKGISLSKDERVQFSNLFEMFDLITPGDGWQRLYYISARLRPGTKVAGLLIATRGDVPQSLLNFIQFFLGRISSFIEYVISSHEVTRQAIRSAIAAIMGRNMSHNIGSHVLARISTSQTVAEAIYDRNFLSEVGVFGETPVDAVTRQDGLDVFGSIPEEKQIGVGRVKTETETASELIAQLSAFLRMRMDFVADIATAVKPPPPMAMSFLGELLLPFVGQRLLWDNLCGSQDLTHKNIAFRVSANRTRIDIEAGQQKLSTKVDSKMAAVAMGMPNGALGCQAFYSIVENFIRNTVKHARNYAAKKLIIKFVLDAEGARQKFNDLFKIVISDSWQACLNDPKLITRLDGVLSQPLIRDGALVSSNRGIKEMKAAAAYLRGLPPEAVEDRSLNPPLLKPVDVDGNLGYELFVLKPKELFVLDLGIVDKLKDGLELEYPKLNELKRQGVGVASSIKIAEEKAPSYSILLVKNAEKRDIESFRINTDLPIRVLVSRDNTIEAFYGSHREKLSTSDVQEIYAHLSNALREGNGEAAATDARELWMKMMCREADTQLWIAEDFKRTEWNVKGLSKLVTQADEPASGSQIVLYARHGFKNRNDSVVFYEPYSKGVDPASFLLENPPKSAEAIRAVIYQLIEAGVLSIIVLDERVQEAADTIKNSYPNDLDAGQQKPMVDWLELMRVHVPRKADLDLENKELTKEQIEEWLTSMKGKCTAGCKAPPLVVIHQGIVDTVGLSDGRMAQTWIDGLKRKINISEVIITSGRGVPDNIPPQARFIPLSTLVLYAVERKSKFHLVKALLAARKTRVGGKRS